MRLCRADLEANILINVSCQSLPMAPPLFILSHSLSSRFVHTAMIMLYHCYKSPASVPSRPMKRFFVSSVHQKTNPLTIGIRREDPARLWERRCPLTPSAVEELVQDAGVRVLVQDCHRRVFGIHEFESVRISFPEFSFTPLTGREVRILGRSNRSSESLSSTHSSRNKGNSSV